MDQGALRKIALLSSVRACNSSCNKWTLCDMWSRWVLHPKKFIEWSVEERNTDLAQVFGSFQNYVPASEAPVIDMLLIDPCPNTYRRHPAIWKLGEIKGYRRGLAFYKCLASAIYLHIRQNIFDNEKFDLRHPFSIRSDLKTLSWMLYITYLDVQV